MRGGRALSGSRPRRSEAFSQCLRDSLPIALGYFTISIAFGLYVVSSGLPPLFAILVSLTNLTSSGQFAGLRVILAGGVYAELILTVLLVNLRYILMALALGQRIPRETGLLRRMCIAFGVTDEIFAVAMRRKRITFPYYLGLTLPPLCGWTGGTATGALLGAVVPLGLKSATGILLYAMFVAIVVPPARERGALRFVVACSGGLSLLLHFLPFTAGLAQSWKIIFSTLAAAALGAFCFPLTAERSGADAQRQDPPGASDAAAQVSDRSGAATPALGPAAAAQLRAVTEEDGDA